MHLRRRGFALTTFAVATVLLTGSAVTAVAADAPPPLPTVQQAAGAATTEPGHGTDPTKPAACDPLDTSQCLLPFPSDWWTRPDPTALTGRRVDFTATAMPRNVAGKPIDNSDYNQLDGFSPGTTIITHVAGVDTAAA